ncbi:hypothetical protein ACFX1X_003659 [Malus domestica]
MRYRSSLLHFARLYPRIEGFIRTGHDEEMKKTPFWNLFKAYRDGHVTSEFCKKIDTDVARIVNQYNKDMKFFVFGDIYARFTPSDIAAILGLPNMGYTLKHTGMKGVRVKHTTFMTRYFCVQKDRVTKSDVEGALIKSVAGDTEESKKDFVRLVCLYFCNSLLFSNTATHVSWTIVKLCEDLDQIGGYNWAAATFDCLFSSLHRAVNPSSVNGCVVALLFWACDKMGMCNKIAGRENICPSFLRWSMTDFHEKLIVTDLATMKSHVNHEMVLYAHADDENVPIKLDDILGNAVNKEDENHANSHSPATKLVEFDAPNWQLIATQDFYSSSSKFSPNVSPRVIATNGMNDSAAEKNNPQSGMSEMDIRCETAEIKVDVLTESLIIADNDLEAARMQIDTLIEENKKLKKQLAAIQNMGSYSSVLTQCSMYRRIKTREGRIRRRLPDFSYGSTIKKRNTSMKRARNSAECSVAAHDVSRKKVRTDSKKICKKKNVLKPISIIDPDFVEPMRTMLENPKEKNTFCDSASKTVDKHPLVQQKHVTSDEGMNWDTDAVKKRLELKKTPVGPYFDDDDFNRLEKFVNVEYSGTALWKSDRAIILHEDIMFLLTNQAITTNTIDAYGDILHMHLDNDNKKIQRESYFMSANIWEFKISNNLKALETFLYNPLLKVFGKYDMIFFPIRHGFEDHYTLALLDTIEGKWYHYNPRLPENGNLHNPCFNDAVQLSKMVMEFLKHHQKRSIFALREGVIVKGLFHPDSGAMEGKMYPMSNDEKLTFQSIKDIHIDWPIVLVQKCPQPPPGS